MRGEVALQGAKSETGSGAHAFEIDAGFDVHLVQERKHVFGRDVSGSTRRERTTA